MAGQYPRANQPRYLRRANVSRPPTRSLGRALGTANKFSTKSAAGRDVASVPRGTSLQFWVPLHGRVKDTPSVGYLGSVLVDHAISTAHPWTAGNVSRNASTGESSSFPEMSFYDDSKGQIRQCRQHHPAHPPTLASECVRAHRGTARRQPTARLLFENSSRLYLTSSSRGRISRLGIVISCYGVSRRLRWTRTYPVQSTCFPRAFRC